MIERPNTRKSFAQASLKYHGLSLFSFGALKGRLSFFSSQLKGLFKDGQIYQLDVKTLNRFLKFCAGSLAVVFVVNLLVSLISLKRDLNLKVGIEKSAQGKQVQDKGLLKAVTYYLEKARERDIFNMGTKVSLDVANANVNKGPSARILEATKDFRLVGISWSDDPDVMIEDTKNQRTFFLKKGQTFASDLKLSGVYKDRVILNYLGEEVELR